MTSLASLQITRESLRADQAQDDYAAALAESVSHSDLRCASMAVRDVLLAGLVRLEARLLEAIEGEHDETRVHYLMSEAIHDELTGMGPAIEAASAQLPIIGERVRAGAKPRGLLAVSQWADRYRWINSGTNSPGRWKTSLTPYLREIMDSLSEHSPVRVVWFQKASGLGGSEVLWNWLSYIMHHLQNKDTLLVVPSLELRDRSFNPRLTKIIEETPVLGELLMSSGTRNRSNRADLLEYGTRARVIKAGANSPDSLRSDHLPYVIGDEIDAYPWDVGGEGDPMTLIENRQRTFSRAKSYYVSTPTHDNASRVAQGYNSSDRRQYHVPCPHCDELQVLEWGSKTGHGLKYRLDRSVEAEAGGSPQVLEAWYVCKHCGAEISEGYKTDMLREEGHGGRAKWIARRPYIKTVRGYHLNALYAPIGLGLGWRIVAQKWVDAQGDTSKMKAFTNTFLGETWTEQGDSIEDISLISRLEDYEDADVPIRRKVAGVDVQKDRLEASIVGFGVEEEAWLLDHIIIPGDTTEKAVWDELHDTLVDAGVVLATIDSGYNTQMVYDFCATRAWAIPIKGFPGSGRPLIEDERKRKQRLRLRRKKGTMLEPLGVDQGKALIYARLKILKPGPGYVHFPRRPAFDDEYFAQLAAEKLVTRLKNGRSFSEWIALRPRNETLDCLNYALAANRLAGPLPEAAPTSASPASAAPATQRAPVPTSVPIASNSWSSRL